MRGSRGSKTIKSRDCLVWGQSARGLLLYNGLGNPTVSVSISGRGDS